jgi:hypothetical protein
LLKNADIIKFCFFDKFKITNYKEIIEIKIFDQGLLRFKIGFGMDLKYIKIKSLNNYEKIHNITNIKCYR